jgi:hypothetical protein
VNADPFNYSSALPNIVVENHNSNVQVSQVIQHVRGGPDIVLPNQISNLGTVQVEGRIVNDTLTNSNLVDDQGELRLPPAGIASFAICSDDENSNLSNASGTASLSHVSYLDWIIIYILVLACM